MGREPSEMSGPATPTCGYFMARESISMSVYVIMNAKTALELDAPTRDIIAFTSISTNKAVGPSLLLVVVLLPLPHRFLLSISLPSSTLSTTLANLPSQADLPID